MLKIAVIGDLILDEYIYGEVNKISPEAPVPVLELDNINYFCGGAANVAVNLAKLGVKPMLYGVIGDDESAQILLGICEVENINTDCVWIDYDRKTTTKTRLVARGQQLLRYDDEERSKLLVNSLALKKICEFADIIILSDYAKGVVTLALMDYIRNHKKPDTKIIVDPKRVNLTCYYGVDIVTPNKKEAEEFCKFKITDKETLVKAGNYITEKLYCNYTIITQGADGLSIFDKKCLDNSYYHIPSTAKQVYDVTGAGDTVISVLSYYLSQEYNIYEASKRANYAAGIVVGKAGTTTITLKEMKLYEKRGTSRKDKY
jgi:D-glycero-beta-D-manno-heptose-7-phosphate kinase